ncbi:MAG: signal recognition particle-docking protein FtsY [Candidatus Aenigmatarchaeota archaeon]
MFGFLKKKLKESIDKVSAAVKGGKEEQAEEHLAEQIPVSKPEPAVPEPAVEKEEEEGEEEELVKEEEKAEVPPEIREELVEEVKEAVKEHEAEQKPEKKLKETPKEKKGLLDKIKRVMTEKTIEEKDVVPVLSDIQTSLLESDVALEVAEKIVIDLKTALVGHSVSRGGVEKIVRESLRSSIQDILDQPDPDIFTLAKAKKPLKIIFLGFNGTGKTTSIARLGYLLKQNGLEPVFAAADTWRAAAQEQLEIHGKNLGIPVIKHKYGADPAAVIFDAVKHAESRKLDVVLADTAGRSHSNAALMDEMKKIIRVNRPDLKLLVIDCLTGNDAVEQAKTFNEAVGVDGVIMTKADVYDKGGAVLSTAWAIKKPILYIGVGQDYKDLKRFVPEEVADSLLK